MADEFDDRAAELLPHLGTHYLSIIAQFGREQRAKGFAEGVEKAVKSVRLHCPACKGSGQEGSMDGDVQECEYCGRQITAIRTLIGAK